MPFVQNALISLSLISGCNTDAPVLPQAKGALVVAVSSDIQSLIPIVSSSAGDSMISSNLSFGLIDSEFDCSLKKKPSLATSWSWSEDGKVLSMELRDDITWQDGAPVTAKDIAFTYELIADPVVKSPRQSYVAKMTEEGRPKVIDDHHIEWHFTEAYERDTQMAHANTALVPAHILKDADRSALSQHPLATAPLSSGPWKLTSYTPGESVVLQGNEKFTGPAELRPKLEQVTFRILPDYASRLAALKNGEADVMQGVSVEDVDLLRKENPNLVFKRRGWRAMDYVAWNQKNPLFADKNVRKALAMAVNINAMIDALHTSSTGESYARRSVGTITPALCGIHNNNIAPLAFDLAQAKTLLSEAGWSDSNKDGTLDKDGQDFAFVLATVEGGKRRPAVAAKIAENLKALGIQVEVQLLEKNTLYNNLENRKFDAALGTWSTALSVDPSNIWHSDTKERTYKFNFVSYANSEADALMEKGLQTPIQQESAPTWKKLQAVIYEDQPYLFLWWMDEIVAVNKRFENTNVNILSALDDLNRWSLAADKTEQAD